jgi:hypothetical protein
MSNPCSLRAGIACAVALASSVSMASGAVVSIGEPDFDRWNYPFAPNGFTGTASVFSDGGFQPFFDLRDGQFTNTYFTGDDIAAGQGAASYVVTSAIVRATIANANGYILGGTNGTSPIELFSTGFRNGFDAFTFTEGASFGPDQFTPGTRNAFAADALGADASNNAGAAALAIGTIAGKGLGDAAADGDVVEFVLDVSNPVVQALLAGGLDAGVLSFSVTTLEAADSTGGGAYPRFATRENTAYSGVSVELVVVPAPGALAALGVMGAMVVRRRR